MASISTLSSAAKPIGADAPIHRANQPIKDAEGRVEMIIDFDFDIKGDDEFSNEISAQDAKRWDKHQGKFVNLLAQYERQYGFSRSGMTSWAKFSATAFLDSKQIEKLAKDKRVTLLTENEALELSAAPPYANFTVGNEFRSWGYQATNGKSGYSFANGRDVYIIDAGVAFHSDLPNVVSRVNVACGSGGNCSTGGASDPYPVVGCYPHATHVAGIIGARGNGSFASAGGAGIYDGVRIHSVSVLAADAASTGICGKNSAVDGVGYALDYVYRKVFGVDSNYTNRGVAIVNMSINPGRLGFTSSGVAETNRSALLAVVSHGSKLVNHPTLGWSYHYYPGALFVQSAGNIVLSGNAASAMYGLGGKNICTEFANASLPRPSLAYKPASNAQSASANDGVMVVGAIHHTGEVVERDISPSVPFSGRYDSNGLTPAPDHSSNYGPCVDVYAPGNLIYSLWGDHSYANNWETRVGVTYSAQSTSGSSGWVFLSGTSMAAPHVAGAAAYLADTFGLSTPPQIEQSVRQYFKPMYNGLLPRLDRASSPVYIVELP